MEATRDWWECTKPVKVGEGIYRYDCADCLEYGSESPSSVIIHARTRREADALARKTYRVDGETDAEARRGGIWTWKLRGDNQFTVPGWVCPYCNCRVSDLEWAAQRDRADANFRGR